MFLLHKQNAIITGAGGAIGTAIALNLASQGANLILSGTNIDNLKKTKTLILETYAKQKIEALEPIIITANLSDKEQATNLFDQAISQVEKNAANSDHSNTIEIVVNNAGITRDNLIIRMSDEDWLDVINTNLSSVFRICKSAVKTMMKNKYGRIINISSVVGILGNAGQSNYCAAKAGIVGMSKAIAREIASRNITINCIAPGFIESKMTQKIPQNIKEQLLSQIPMKKMGEPKDIANCVSYLASNEASYVTGQTFHINGGMLMA